MRLKEIIILLRQTVIEQTKVFRFTNHNQPVPLQISGLVTNPDPGRCPHCQKQCGTHLRRHINVVHLKLKPFKCEQCDKRFSERSNLSKHFKVVHLKIKAFKCQYCDKKFSKEYGRSLHVNSVHLREKPHFQSKEGQS